MAVEGTWGQVETEVNAASQQIERKVTIGGTEYDPVTIQIESAYDQLCTTSNIELRDPGGIAPNDEVRVWQGYNGYYVETFRGFVDVIDVSEYPTSVLIRCRDIIKRAADNFLASEDAETTASYMTFDGIQAEAAVQALLNDSKLNSYTYSLDTSNFTIGGPHPIGPDAPSEYAWKVNLISAAEAIQQVCGLLGWHFHAYRNTLYFTNLDPFPSGTPVWTYQDGASSNIKKVTYTQSDEKLRNKIVVFGYDQLKSVKKASSPFLPTGFYKAAVLSSDLFDTQAMCDWIANRVLSDLNRKSEIVTLDTLGNPLLKMGHTLTINASSVGVNEDYFLFSLRSNQTVGNYTMQFTLVK